MNRSGLVKRSLRYYARSHLGALLGAVAGSAVLIGALIVGDSVRGSLRKMALLRLGYTQVALVSNDRLFREELVREIQPVIETETAPVLMLPGTASRADGKARANNVQVLGVDESFWQFGLEPSGFNTISNRSVVLNSSLSRQLNAQPGDSIVVRVQRPTELSRDAPLSPEEDASRALRLSVQAVVDDEQMGRFGLQSSQVPPFNAFVSLAFLQDQLGVGKRANLLLGAVRPGGGPALDEAAAALKRTWKLEDAQLELRRMTNWTGFELRTERVFLDRAIVEAAQRVSAARTEVLTYLVNSIEGKNGATPYSMVAAVGPPLVPAEMADSEIVINEWLAEDLQAQPGDELKLRYYVVGHGRKLEEKESVFKVREIVPLAGLAADPSLMPDFPGLTDAENCRDWDTGFGIETDKVREKDERYWDDYRGTPKAFVSLAAGRRMWANRFGDLTAVRFGTNGTAEALAEALRANVDPASVGLRFEPVRERALAASSQGQDFGQLFLGFSMFLIAAALLLMGLLFQFGIEQRAGEVGTLLAVGFTAKQVRRFLLREGVVLAFIGSVLGVAGGILYARLMLHGLSTVWREAVGTSALGFAMEPGTPVIGLLAGTAVASLAIWFTVRRQGRRPARELLAGGGEVLLAENRGSRGKWIGFLAFGAAAVLILLAYAREDASPEGIFFGAGALLLVGSLGFCAWLLSSFGRGSSRVPTLPRLGLSNAGRRRNRSLATIALLACGSFLVTAIGVFRLDAQKATDRSSGTGGFALIGESTAPVVYDLNSKAGRESLGLDEKLFEGVSVVPFRVRPGDDASCLNLNRAQEPRLLGVQAELLQRREAFTFTKLADGYSSERPWLALDQETGDNVVPAIGDAASIQWALGKKVGDVLTYRDESGREFQVRIVGAVQNSILQGSLIIAEEQFVRRFPNQEGYRMLLIDAPADRAETLSTELSRSLEDFGLELVPAQERLAAFNAVQNTYLSTFQALGGLGLLLGSFGLGVVVLRNVYQRRAELAVLQALGFRWRGLRWLILSEHGALLGLGLGIGILSALIAVLPALLTPGRELPMGSIGWTLALVLLNGALWTWMATSLALRGKLLDALRND